MPTGLYRRLNSAQWYFPQNRARGESE